MPRRHDLGERREVPDRVEVGVFLHVPVVVKAVPNRREEQEDGSFGQITGLRRVLVGKGLGGQGAGTGGGVVQPGIPGMLLERRFERRQRLVGSLAQFGRHDHGQVELLALGGVSLPEPLQVRPRLVLVTQPGMGDGTDLIGSDGFRVLLDHGIEVVDGFLASPSW